MELWIVIGLVVLVAVGFVVIKIVQSSSPQGFARGLARAQLLSFLAYRDKYPNGDLRSSYAAALGMRPGYSPAKVETIVSGAEEACRDTGLPFNFQAVVVMLAVREYLERMGPGSPLPVNTLREAVVGVVPANL